MSDRIEVSDLSVDAGLYRLVEKEIAPGTLVDTQHFWHALAEICATLGDSNRALLTQREWLQKKLDAWHQAHPGQVEMDAYQKFLIEIGYLVPEVESFTINTHNVDAEVAVIAGPQLVVPVDNARYALNAANARWYSLYDALYGTDAIADTEGCQKTADYNPLRGRQVIAFARDFLDQAAPLTLGSHHQVTRYSVRAGKLVMLLGNGREGQLACRECFAGYRGKPQSPSAILLRHHHLHIEIRIDKNHQMGQHDLAHICDLRLEAAITTIMDCEDSVAAVDAEDKITVYRNWCGLMKGDLSATVMRGKKSVERRLNPDLEFLSPSGQAMTIPGRSLMFVRNVGTHMYTDAVCYQGEEIPEAFLDAMVTALAAKHDLLKKGPYCNSRAGSVYIVKPKIHGVQEVEAAVTLFSLVEQALGLEENTLKIGIMDEERRTTLNLKSCIQAANERVVFINTGFLDRTGDEIHTSMEAGTMIPKNEMKDSKWLLAYEDWNVDTGLELGMSGRGQIGKGMWAASDNMAAMMVQKIAHPRAGANTAWVPSPVAACLHAIHYHQVDVSSRQNHLRHYPSAQLEDMLIIPLLGDRKLSETDLRRELENNAQGILGYVVRWVDQGIGCSKVADINNIYLMEDRATLRISSQHIANWLRHKVVTEHQVRDVFKKMAGIVDQQNADDPIYRNMALDFQRSIAFQAALDLVFCGCEAPNGYTETILHNRRREAKNKQQEERILGII